MKLKRLFLYFIFLLGIAGIIDTIKLSTIVLINLGVVLPGAVGAVLVIISFYKLWIDKNGPLIKNMTLRGIVFVFIFLVFASFIIIEALIIKSNFSQMDKKADYLIILGAGVRGKTISLTLQERLNKGIEYLKTYPSVKVVVSGGKGSGEEISEAEAMRGYLISKGIDQNRIIEEDMSTSTMENFKFSKAILEKSGTRDIGHIMIVTSDFHMLRAKMLAKRNGFNPYGIPAKTPSIVLVNDYIREYFAVIKSFFLDR